MLHSNITPAVKSQLLSLNPNFDFDNGDKDTLDFYGDLLKALNSQHPFLGFKLGIDTGDNLSNILIITFDPDDSYSKKSIERIVSHYTDGLYQCSFIDNHLVISLEH